MWKISKVSVQITLSVCNSCSSTQIIQEILFSGKFTQVAKILHDRRSRRSWQISSLHPSSRQLIITRWEKGPQWEASPAELVQVNTSWTSEDWRLMFTKCHWLFPPFDSSYLEVFFSLFATDKTCWKIGMDIICMLSLSLTYLPRMIFDTNGILR